LTIQPHPLFTIFLPIAEYYLARCVHSRAVHKVPTVSVTDDSTVLDVEHLAFVLHFIQNTVRHISHGLTDIQVVGSEDRELLSSGTAAVGQFLVRVIRMRVVVLRMLALKSSRLRRGEFTGSELLALGIQPATAEESDLDLVIGVCVRPVASSCRACC
jgi:hypothetical protein